MKILVSTLAIAVLWLLYILFLIVGVPEPILNKIIVILVFASIGVYISEKLDCKD